MVTSSVYTICDVCRLLDYDCTQKFCGYCGLCDAYICQSCQCRWDRRLRAAAKRMLEPGFKGDPEYTKKLNERGELVNEAQTDSGTNA